MESNTALAVQEAPLALFGTTDPIEVIARASRIATELAKIVNERKLYAVIQGRKFPTVEGWTMLGGMVGVFAHTEWVNPVKNEAGDVRGYHARVSARTLGGIEVGAAEALCMRGESAQWNESAKDYALMSMAQTRATGKAMGNPLRWVFKLAGYETSSAEEMPSSVTEDGEIINPSPASREVVDSEPSQEILGNSEAAATSPKGSLDVQPTTGTVAPRNGKRRGRPLGSKNHAKEVMPNEGARSAVPAPSVDMTAGAPASPPPPAITFGDPSGMEEAHGILAEEDVLKPLRGELYVVAQRLLKLQYIEKGGNLPPSERWEAEVYKTLGTYIERKHGTGVALYDLEEKSLQAAIEELKGYVEQMMGEPEEAGGGETAAKAPASPAVAPSPPQDTRTVSLHKPIVRNAIAAPRRGGEATQVDPQVPLARARALSDLRNRTTAILATKEGLVELSSKNEERLRVQADAVMERVSQNSFQKAIKDLDVQQLELLVERARAAAQ